MFFYSCPAIFEVPLYLILSIIRYRGHLEDRWATIKTCFFIVAQRSSRFPYTLLLIELPTPVIEYKLNFPIYFPLYKFIILEYTAQALVSGKAKKKICVFTVTRPTGTCGQDPMLLTSFFFFFFFNIDFFSYKQHFATFYVSPFFEVFLIFFYF